MDPAGTLLTAADVAARLQVHPETVLRLARRGVIPRVQIGRKIVRFRPQDVDAIADKISAGDLVVDAR